MCSPRTPLAYARLPRTPHPPGSLFALVKQRGTHTDHRPCTAERGPRPRFQCGTPSFSEPLVSNVPRASAPTARLPPLRVDAHPRAPSSASCGSACSLEQWAFCLESAWQGRVHFRVVQPPPPCCARRGLVSLPLDAPVCTRTRSRGSNRRRQPASRRWPRGVSPACPVGGRGTSLPLTRRGGRSRRAARGCSRVRHDRVRRTRLL